MTTKPNFFRRLLQTLVFYCASRNPLIEAALAFNTKVKGNGIAIGFATNVAMSGLGDWELLAPYGESDYWQEDSPGKWNKYTQVFTRNQADAMTTAFNSLKEQQGANFRGLPVFVGHPDADPKRWPDDKRLGGLNEMEPRADGLYVKVAWNDLGEKNRKEGYYVYPSPAWLYPRALAANAKRIVPNELKSVGLTNTPRIPGSQPWTNSDNVPENDTDEAGEEATNDMKHKENLLKVLGLPADATDDQIDAGTTLHLKNKAADKAAKDAADADAAAKAKKAAEDKAATDAAANSAAGVEAAKFRGIAINSALDTAINAGRITAAERPAWETKLATNYDGASVELAALKPALDTKSLNLKPTGARGDLTTPHGRQIAFNCALDAHIAAGLNFEQAMNAMRANPAEAAIIAAMNAAK